MANITIIPPQAVQPKTLRVAAYCRVSTDFEQQQLSYTSQIRNYTQLIRQHEGWELVDIYADEAVSATQTEKRDEFNRMMADCRKGRIDRILVKSISRFARNTKDCLTALRELARLGVTVQFEKENIDTGTLTTELMVSVFSSLAQQESVSISENVRMGYRRRMERGEFITTKAPYGYRLVNKRDLEIIPEQAEWVRWIFHAYLSGHGMDWIAEELTRRQIPIREGAVRWNAIEIHYILQNEKYIGDTLCQKTFRTGFPCIPKWNHGEVDQFYVEGTHPAIIDRETFESVQSLMQRRKRYKTHLSPPEGYPLASKIVCGHCATTFYRRVYQQGSLIVWICRQHLKDASSCPVKAVSEPEIYRAFVRMYNKLRLHEDIILKPAVHQMEILEANLHRKNPAMLNINEAIAQATQQSYKVAQLQAKGLLDADASSAKLTVLNAQLTQLRAERKKLLRKDDIHEAVRALQQTIHSIHHGPAHLAEFDQALFMELVERLTIDSRTRVHFHLYGGIKLTEYLWED